MAKHHYDYYFQNLEANKQKSGDWSNRLSKVYSSKSNYNSTKSHNVYGPWQPCNWLVSGDEILSTHGLNWWYGVHWKAGRTGQHMKNDAVTRESIRQAIASKLGCSAECIMLNPQINARGNTPTKHTGIGNAIMFSSYTIGYQYRSLEVKTETYFDQAKYNADIQYHQGQIKYYNDSVNKGNIAKRYYDDILKKQKEEKAIIENIKSMDGKEKSVLLSKVFNKTDANSKFTLSEIKKSQSQGDSFDAGYLCYLAILESREDLFDFSLENIAGGAFIGHIYKVDGKTLLQHIINSSNSSFLAKAISRLSDVDISTISIRAIEQNDIQTLNKIMEMQPDLLQKTYSGFTLLQHILNKSTVDISAIEQIIALDSDVLNILASNGDSAFKIAITKHNSTSPEIIEMISKHIDISTELNQLTDIESEFKDLIIEKSDIDTLIRLLSGAQISLEEYMLENLELVEENSQVQVDDMLLNNAGDLEQTLNHDVLKAGAHIDYDDV